MGEKSFTLEPKTGEGFEQAKEKAGQALGHQEEAEKESGKEQCPHCQQWFKRLAMHERHCKKAPDEAAELDPELELIFKVVKDKLGKGSVQAILHGMKWGKQRQLIAAGISPLPKVEIFCPPNFVEETAELHAAIIEYGLKKYGPENSEIWMMLMAVGVQWYGVVQINFMEPQNYGPNATPKEHHDLRGVRVGEKPNSETPNEA